MLLLQQKNLHFLFLEVNATSPELDILIGVYMVKIILQLNFYCFIKIHIIWLGYRFSIYFLIHTLRYAFLFGNHKHLQKSRDFWFAICLS
jgi:hypothetical protein